MWAVTSRFGYTQLRDDLNGSNVHRLENVMTVFPGFRFFFRSTKGLTYTATYTENKYKLEAAERFILRQYSGIRYIQDT